MSYLNPLRLHFAGRFQAAPSTVNNIITHFDNANFRPEYQVRGAAGLWNPRGDADWRFIGCKVTSAWLAGEPVAHGDPILQCLIADSDHKVAAKLADLDPQQQMVSEIWGLEVRICDAHGATLLRGQFEPAAFTDIWDRSASGGGDVGAGAMYQSVLTELEWADTGDSPFLQTLRASATGGLLSIKFNVDGYNLNFDSPEFTRGRIVGSIGPASATEPRHFVPGRQFMTTGLPSGNFFAPQGQINFCVAVVDAEAGKVYLDLGNALPSTNPGGPLANLGPLALTYEASSAGSTYLLPIGGIPYTRPHWYESTAGVIALPSGRRLTGDELNAIEANPLALALTASSGFPAPAITESPNGVYVRADRFVYRLNPGDQANVRLFATVFGQPYAGARIISILDPSQIQGGPGQPDPATPQSALDFPARLVTGPDGSITLLIQASNPGAPRDYIDGQVYGVRPALEETLDFGAAYPFNPWNFVSLLLWSEFKADDPPTWHGGLQPIFQQYANLYPVMDRFLNLADYHSVCTHRHLLMLAFGLGSDNPNSMPATRDLSAAKRQAILRWLANPGPDGNPLLGSPRAPMPAAAAAAGPLRAVAQPAAPPEPDRGGKAAAATRRLFLRGARRVNPT